MGRTCGSDVSEHYDGRAWDWMLNVHNPSQEAVAQSVLTWLTAPDRNGVKGATARRFGIMYIIHNKKMWRSYAPERGWAPYHGSSPHTDHIHFSFNYDGAAGRTSWWTGVPTRSHLTSLPRSGTTLPTATRPTTPPVPAATRPVTAYTRLSYGMTVGGGAHVAGQARRVADVGPLPVADPGPGRRLPEVRGAAADRRRRCSHPAGALHPWLVEARRQAGPEARDTDVPDPELRDDLGRGAHVAGQARWVADVGPATCRRRGPGSSPTRGSWGCRRPAWPMLAPSRCSSPVAGRGPPPSRPRSPRRPTYRTLSYGMTSAAVRTLQARLGGLPTSGRYLSQTRARVVAYQRFVGLPADRRRRCSHPAGALHPWLVEARRQAGPEARDTDVPDLELRDDLGRGAHVAGQARWVADVGQATCRRRGPGSSPTRGSWGSRRPAWLTPGRSRRCSPADGPPRPGRWRS